MILFGTCRARSVPSCQGALRRLARERNGCAYTRWTLALAAPARPSIPFAVVVRRSAGVCLRCASRTRGYRSGPNGPRVASFAIQRASERSELLSRGKELLSQGDALLSQGDALLSQWDALLSQWDALLSQWDALLSQWDALLSQWDALLSQWDALLSQWDALLSQWDALLSHGDELLSCSVPPLVPEERPEADVPSLLWGVTASPGVRRPFEQAYSTPTGRRRLRPKAAPEQGRGVRLRAREVPLRAREVPLVGRTDLDRAHPHDEDRVRALGRPVRAHLADVGHERVGAGVRQRRGRPRVDAAGSALEETVLRALAVGGAIPITRTACGAGCAYSSLRAAVLRGRHAPGAALIVSGVVTAARRGALGLSRHRRSAGRSAGAYGSLGASPLGGARELEHTLMVRQDVLAADAGPIWTAARDVGYGQP